MARRLKEGANYFSLDVGFLLRNDVRRIKKAYGGRSIEVLICLLCNIYREKGYYMLWNKDVIFMVADDLGANERFITDVVSKAVEVGFFDVKQWTNNRILTSEEIQERYFFDICKRRKDVKREEKYLIDSIKVAFKGVNVYVNSINDDINSDNVYISTQSKGKESKEKKSRVCNNNFNFKEKQEKTFNRKRQELAQLVRELGKSKEI